MAFDPTTFNQEIVNSDGYQIELYAGHSATVIYSDALLEILSRPWIPWDDDSTICPHCGSLSTGQHHDGCAFVVAARALGVA
jgi:hypothetical protein